MAIVSDQISEPRILIFTHDGRGLGHLRRLSRLGKELQKNASVLFVTGHREASWLVPPECEFVRLPNLDSLDPKRSRQWGRKPFLRNGLAIGYSLRRELIKSSLEQFKPNAIIIDYLPLGLHEEMREFLMNMPGCRKYFISRGILGSPEQTKRDIFTPTAVEALRDLYDMILVMADPAIVNTAEEYATGLGLEDKITYVGYAAETVNDPMKNLARAARKTDVTKPWVLCSAGGGKDGEDLTMRCWEISQIFPECYFDIIVGPRSRLMLNANTVNTGGRVRLLSSEERDLPLLHASADVVIQRGGYNSLMEAFMGDATIIVAPIATDYEQVNHAKRLSSYRDIRVVENLERLDLELDKALHDKRDPALPQSSLNMNGLQIGSRVILSDLEQARVLLNQSNQMCIAS